MKVQTAFRLEPAILDALREISKDGRPMGWHVDKALNDYLGRPADKPIVKAKAVPVKALSASTKSEADEVIDYLNIKAGTSYKHSKASRDCIEPRLKEFSISDCKTVIDKKCNEWLNTDMAKYLRPATLFQASKFEGYLNQISGTADNREKELDDWVNGKDMFNSGETIEHEYQRQSRI